MRRVILVGDVHGCLEEFAELLDTLRYVKGEDRLISLGDLMDRGPEPAACVKLARSVGAEIVQSNHDEKHVRYRKHLARKASDPKYSGSPPRLSPRDVEENAKLSDDDIAWLANAPNIIRISCTDIGGKVDLIAVHAGFEGGPKLREPEEVPRGVCIRCRYVDESGCMVPSEKDDEGRATQPANTRGWAENYPGNHHVVYGHAVHSLDKPRIDWSGQFFRVGLDTGCCYGGHLSARVFNGGPEWLVQVKAKGVYGEWYGPWSVTTWR
jgi:bis(5'-nucleosyl)-tetraphosphatase (symmetrical)